MKPYISTQDISLLASALSILACLMQLSPPLTYPAVESEYLLVIYSIAHSPLSTGVSLDALLVFFAALVEADLRIATHVIPNVTLPLQKTNRSKAIYGNVAKCIRTIVRNHTSLAVYAACLGKLTTTNPSRYLPQLYIGPYSQCRSCCSCNRCCSHPLHHSYDKLLSALIPGFLIEDQDLTVRRLAISALNSAACNKPQLIRDHLTVLLPRLYKETVGKPELIKTVQMGPWTHKVDEGLDTRKTAYEMMYNLLNTCLSRLLVDLHWFLVRVIAGLGDDSDEVKVHAYALPPCGHCADRFHRV